jgi:uncharacterized protein
VIHTLDKKFLYIPIGIFLLLLILYSPSSSADQFPAPKGLINDFADIIPEEYEQRMSLFAREVLSKTSSTLTLVTLKDIGGDDIDDFTNRLYEKWGIGEKGKDKGVMILLALTERKVRIEVGYGLEHIITDGLAGQIRDTAMMPYLKKGQFGQGLLNGLFSAGAMIAKYEGIELTGMPVASSGTKVTSKKKGFTLFSFLFLLLIFFFLSRSRLGLGSFLLLMFLGGKRNGFGGQGGFGGFGGGFGGFGGGMSGGGGASGSF